MKNKIIILLSVFIFGMTLGIKGAMAAAATDVACKAPCINSFEIQDGQVGNADIADGAVSDAKITGPISSSKIQKPANVVVVAKSGGDYTTIADALNAISPSATNPYVIDVMPGTYTENITMKSYVHLRGAGRDVTTIQGTINITSLSNIEISGFTIAGSGSSGTGIGTIGSNGFSNLSISNNIIKGFGFGIYPYNGSNLTIKGNIFKNNITAMVIEVVPSVIISENVITGNTGSYSVISWQSDGTLIEDNIINSNGGDGVWVYGGGEYTIRGNTIKGNNGYGIWCRESTTTIIGNSIANNSTEGISVANLCSATIINNKIVGNTSTDISINYGSPNISFNVYDTISGTAAGAYNVKSNGTPW